MSERRKATRDNIRQDLELDFGEDSWNIASEIKDWDAAVDAEMRRRSRPTVERNSKQKSYRARRKKGAA